MGCGLRPYASADDRIQSDNPMLDPQSGLTVLVRSQQLMQENRRRRFTTRENFLARQTFSSCYGHSETRMVSRILSVLAVTLSLVYMAEAFAIPWSEAARKIDYKNSKVVPPFCQVNSPNYSGARYKKKFGQDFTWINHYCDAKAKIPVCWDYPKKARNACLTRFMRGAQYAIDHTKNPAYPLLPLLYTEVGTLLKNLERYGESIHSFQQAINKNKKYIPAYSRLVDVYILLNDFDRAEQTAKSGLEQKTSKSLKRRLEKIAKLRAEAATKMANESAPETAQ